MHQNQSQIRQNVNPNQNLVPPRNKKRRANNREQNSQNEQSFIDKIKKSITPSNIKNALLFLVMLGIVLWIGSTFFSPQALLKRQPAQLSSFGVTEMAAPDQMTLRSYYFYKQLKQLSIQKAKDPKSFPQTFYKDYQNLTFWETFTLFKVLRSYQLATDCGKPVDISSDNQLYKDHQFLGGAMNMSNVFQKIPIQNQGGCGSCYSFPIAATIEYIYAMNGINIKLSQQQIIDCAIPPGDQDKVINQCQDGNMTRGFQYVRDQGLVQLKYYPYQSGYGFSNDCRVPKDVPRYKISGFVKIPKNCSHIIDALNRGFPVATMIHGSPLSYWNMKQPFEDCKRDQPNHAVTLIGLYNKTNNYYVRNSWGVNWGWNGYFEMKSGNSCGACKNGAIFPYLQFKQGQPKSYQNVIKQEFKWPQLTPQQKQKIIKRDQNNQDDDDEGLDL